MNIIINSFKKDISFLKDCCQQKELSGDQKNRLFMVASRIFVSFAFVISLGVSVRIYCFQLNIGLLG